MKSALVAVAVFGAVGCGGGGNTPSGGGGSFMDGSAGAAVASGGASGAPRGGSGGSATGGGSGGSAMGGSTAGPAMLTLTVNVSGDGKVTSAPAGIDCGSSCEMEFPAGATVELDAIAGGGVLTAWAGDCTGTSACSVTLDSDVEVSATFEPFEVGANAHGIAVTPDGTEGLVTLANNPGTLIVFSLSDGAIIDSIAVGEFPGAVAVAPDGSKAVVNNLGNVSVVTLATQEVSPVEPPCASDTLYDIAITPDSSSAVTTMFSGDCVTTRWRSSAWAAKALAINTR